MAVRQKSNLRSFKPPGTLARRRILGRRRAPAVSHVQPSQAYMNLIYLFYWLANHRCNRNLTARLQAHFLKAARGFASGGSKNPASTLLCKSNVTCQSAWQRRESRVPHDAWPTRRTTVFVRSQKRNYWLSCFSRQRQYSLTLPGEQKRQWSGTREQIQRPLHVVCWPCFQPLLLTTR